ncbi:MAG TPA: hypothetical protein VLX28_13125 [Thermoanaerobaculia bacterium]|nr:hypothetical protein [Thermoanaerobaculia bacterium]
MKLVSRPARPLTETHGKALPHAGNGSVLGLLVGLLRGDHFFEAGAHQSREGDAPLYGDVPRFADQIPRQGKFDVLGLHKDIVTRRWGG